MEKTYLNLAGRNPEAVRILVEEKIKSFAKDFGFRNVEEITLKGEEVGFDFTTKMKTKVTGKVTVTKEKGVLDYKVEPENAPFLFFITEPLENAVRDIFFN